jgi:hypothetical protein
LPLRRAKAAGRLLEITSLLVGLSQADYQHTQIRSHAYCRRLCLVADTADELCRVIQEVLQSPNAYRHLQVRGYEKMRANYSWDAIAERFLSAVEKALENKSPSVNQ